jgi:hypothetical protein
MPAIVNSVDVNVGVKIPFGDTNFISFGYIFTSGTARTYDWIEKQVQVIYFTTW